MELSNWKIWFVGSVRMQLLEVKQIAKHMGKTTSSSNADIVVKLLNGSALVQLIFVSLAIDKQAGM